MFVNSLKKCTIVRRDASANKKVNNLGGDHNTPERVENHVIIVTYSSCLSSVFGKRRFCDGPYKKTALTNFSSGMCDLKFCGVLLTSLVFRIRNIDRESGESSLGDLFSHCRLRDILKSHLKMFHSYRRNYLKILKRDIVWSEMGKETM